MCWSPKENNYCPWSIIWSLLVSYLNSTWCVYTCLYVYTMNKHAFLWSCEQSSVCMHVHVHVYVYLFGCVWVHMWIHACVPVCVSTWHISLWLLFRLRPTNICFHLHPILLCQLTHRCDAATDKAAPAHLQDQPWGRKDCILISLYIHLPCCHSNLSDPRIGCKWIFLLSSVSRGLNLWL